MKGLEISYGYGMEQVQEQPTSILTIDPWLAPFRDALERRLKTTAFHQERICPDNGTLIDFALAHEHFGLHKVGSGWIIRERAPNASKIAVIGEFSNWGIKDEYFFESCDNGEWVLTLPDEVLSHGMLYKLVVFWSDESGEHSGERIPSFCRRVRQDPSDYSFCAQVWNPLEPYQWMVPRFEVKQQAPRIYEAHVGMSSESPKVASYREFTENILPRIKKAGYNTIQLMAVQEHPYYGSFGYQVSNFFAPSSRFGTPEDLMRLVDTAHSMGIAVIMDLVHSHAVKNEVEGLSRFDGSYTLYFHGGDRGEHSAWNTRTFDYGKIETLHFLLSNCRYWLDVFKFDGFRFDGVTSMIYHDHGLGSQVDSYDHYFSENVDEDAISYLTLANTLIHDLRPDAITVAEEVTALPGLAAPRDQGGVGFDYRLAMGVPDFWIKLLKHTRDEDWNVSEIWRELSGRRAEERTIHYCESHDQALVGDKTIMFRLADKEMYWHMSLEDSHPTIERAVALHKIIRLLTLLSAGHGYLNFMGNEFGHPEWVDFPREGNGWSYHHARRQWSLVDSEKLKYQHLSAFDRSMMAVADFYNIFDQDWIDVLHEHVSDQVLAFGRGDIVCVANLNPVRSFEGYGIHVPLGAYKVVLNTDEPIYGGFARVDNSISYRTQGAGSLLKLYIPNRTALVLKRN